MLVVDFLLASSQCDIKAPRHRSLEQHKPFSFLFSSVCTCLFSLFAPLLLLSPSRNSFPRCLPLSLPLAPPSFFSAPAVWRPIPRGERSACREGRVKKTLVTGFQLIGPRVSKPLWGNALHSWAGNSLQPLGKKIK